MAGHSKFKNIQHRKGAQDKKRAKIFAKLGREITVAAKEGLPDPAMNPRLRLAVQNARAQNMPNDRIKKAIEVAQGAGDGADFTEIRYEGYGPGGTAVIVEALTDNRNRTAAEVRAAFSKNNGSLGESGSVAFNFDQKGVITYPLEAGDHETLFEAAVEAGAEDCQTGDEGHEIICQVEDFNDVRTALEEALGEAGEAGLKWLPNITVDVNEEQAADLIRLIDALEDNDDVQTVFTNFEIADDILERLAS